MSYQSGPENIARLRELHTQIKIATLEFAERCQAELDGPGSKTQQQIADAIGCDQSVVSRAVNSLKIANYAVGISGDHEKRVEAYEQANRQIRTPKPQPINQPPEISSHDLARETADFKARQHGEIQPLNDYGPEDALNDWMQTLDRIVRDMARLAGSSWERGQLRTELIKMIDGIFDET